jgi:hypothetical protein
MCGAEKFTIQRIWKEFEIGYLVTTFFKEVSNFPQAEYNKLKYKKIRLCKILKKFGDNVYQIELPEGIDISHIFNVLDLYQYQEGDEAEFNEEDEEPIAWRKQLSRSKPEDVEEAMDKKITKTGHASYKKYLVKWKGKPQEKRK